MSKKIKILHVLPNLSQGGAEKICRELLLKIDPEKFSSALLLFKDNNSVQVGREELLNNNIEIISLRKRCLFDLFNFWKIIKAIKKYQPDIVHTHLGGDIYGRLAAKLVAVPIIVSTEHNLNNSERRLATIAKKITARYATKIFAVSEAVKKDALKRYNIPAKKIEVIYNGIDITEFKANNFKTNDLKNDDLIVFGALGRLTEQKGFETLIEAAAQLKNKNYLLKIAGVGELAEKLNKRITELGLNKQVQLVGAVKAADFLASLDIFVFPSLWEGLGLAVLEAGALAKPVIASDIDGIKEVLNDDNAWLFPAGEIDKLAARMDFVMTNLESAAVKIKAEKLKNLINAHFNLDLMIEAYREWYEILLLEKSLIKNEVKK